MYFLFTGRWAYNWGGVISEGGLISGSLRYSRSKLLLVPWHKTPLSHLLWLTLLKLRFITIWLMSSIKTGKVSQLQVPLLKWVVGKPFGEYSIVAYERVCAEDRFPLL